MTGLILLIVCCIIALIAAAVLVICLVLHRKKQEQRAVELQQQLKDVGSLARKSQYIQIKTWRNVPIEDEPKPLRGRKRLVDEAGHTKVIANMRDSERELHNHSHYNVRDYKVYRKNRRKEKRAHKDYFFDYNEKVHEGKGKENKLLPLGWF